MKKTTRALALALALAGTASAAAAEPLRLAEDLRDEIRIGLNGNADYVYAYCYPQADPEDPSAELINTFYQYLADDAAGFEVPMNADYYKSLNPQEDVTVRISYTVTCNNDDFFSALIHTEQDGLSVWKGHTFSRKGLKPGMSVALPYLLGLLESGETDTWLQDRQTARANELIRGLVWENLEERDGKDLELNSEMREEDLEYGFFPEEDFYLDAEGEPVFYLQPGFAAEGDGCVTVPISLETILDEM